MKRCSACRRVKPVTAFQHNAARRDGRDVWCRVCRGVYYRRWLATNREAYREQQRAYYRENSTRLREYYREYQRRRRALMQAGKWPMRAAGRT